MTRLSRRQLLATASGVGAATVLAGAMGASANPFNMQQGHSKQKPDRPSDGTVLSGPL